MPHSLFSDKCFWKIYPMAYDGPVGGHYNRPCPVELFTAKGPASTYQRYLRQENSENEAQIGLITNKTIESIEIKQRCIDNKEYNPKPHSKSGVIRSLGKGIRRLKNRVTGKTEVKKIKNQ